MKHYRFFLILIFVNISLFADVTLKSADSFIKGESFIFQFEAVGSSVKFPEIEKIDGFVVEDLGTSRSLQIINGNYDEKLSKNYRIAPTQDFIIPSFTFFINDKEVKTNPKKITMQKLSKTTSDRFDLTLVPSKKSLYVGEELLVKLIFKRKKGLQITNLGLEPPHFENFWYKKIENSNKNYEENGYDIQELHYLLFPQKSGELTVDPLRVDVQMMDRSSETFGFFSASRKLIKIYSNPLKFEVKDLPSNVSLIGDFTIKANVDKRKIKQGESISYKIDISGTGNIDDIEDIKLNIENATIYDNKPEIKTSYTKKGYEGNYSKIFSIVPNSSTVIPSIEFNYFSKKDKKIITKKTRSFKIEVKKEVEKKVILEKSKELIPPKEKIIIKKEDTSLEDKIFFFLLGVVLTLLIIGLYMYVRLQTSKKVKNDIPLIKLVKSKKNKQELLKVLIPYIKSNQELDELIFQCESEKDFKVLRKEIIELLKEIKI